MTATSVPAVTALLGRDAELAELLALVRAHPVVTVAGPGGIGKTRLAGTAATTLASERAVQVVQCLLAEVPTAQAVRPYVAARLGVTLAAGTRLTDALRGRELLVSLDNCEHVVAAVREVLDELLAAGAGIRVMATSRESLGYPGERLLRLGPLALPPPVGPDPADAASAATSPSVTLLVTRAQEARPQFSLGPDNLASVVELCRQLDGSPLALELAAARMRSMRPDEVLERLATAATLRADPKAPVPARHRDLDAVVDWSYALLSEPERRVFERLSVCAGGALLPTVEAVAAGPGVARDDVLDLLDALVDRSLVVVRTEAGTRTRYGMLETLRPAALRRLVERGDHDATRDRHAGHLAEVAAGLWARSAGCVDDAAYDRLATDLPGVAAAVDWCVSHDDAPDRALALVAPMWELCYRSMARAVADLAVRVLTRWPGCGHPLAGEVAGVAATAFLVLDEHTDARTWAEISVAAPAAASGYGHRVLAELVAWRADDPASALVHLDAARTEAESAGRLAALVEQEILRATLLVQAGRPDEARVVAAATRGETRCRYRWEALHSELIEAVLVAPEDPASAERRLRELVAAAGTDPYSTVITHAALGSALAVQGRPAEAAQLLQHALGTYLRAGMRQHWQTLVAAALAVAGPGPDDEAVRRLTAVVRASGTAVVRLHAPRWSADAGALGGDRHPMPAQDALELALEVVRRVAAASPGGAPAAAPSNDVGEMGFDGTVWTLRWDGRSVRLSDGKGLHDLATLLARPGERVPAAALAGDPAGDPDRARSTVGWRLRNAIRRIEAVDPVLGRHLRYAVHCGSVCTYAPTLPVQWSVLRP